MKTILLAGKLNDSVKSLSEFLSKWFKIQISSENDQVFAGMMKVVHPDLVLISLVGLHEVNRALFNQMELNYPEIPVITIGTEQEQRNFLTFYKSEQFENLIRPLENHVVEEAVCRRLHLDLLTKEDPSERKKKNVLVVDDNAMTLRTIKSMLDQEFDVTLANSGMKALTTIGKKRPDVILLDYEMPVCDGKQTFEMIRADEDLTSIPVIFLTGVNERKHIQAVLALHPAGYLLKPAVQETLISAIYRALEEKA